MRQQQRLAHPQLPLGHRRAPSRRLRDRARPERASDRPTPALRPLLPALMGPMHVLRWGALARVVRRRARGHAGGLGRARSGAGVCSSRACIFPLVKEGRKERGAHFTFFSPCFLFHVLSFVAVRAY